LTEGDLFFCVSDDDEGHHLGDSSSFRLRWAFNFVIRILCEIHLI
jgi:hypothetical protein